jgi:tetratricopeptide (TPR) repeat protein
MMDIQMDTEKPLGRTGFQIFLIVCVAILAYGRTLDVPFYLDDFVNISENLAIQDFGDPGQIVDYSPPRAFGFFTLAANYALHGESVAGYHLVNILIHLLSGIAVFTLLRGLMLAPATRRSGADGLMQWLPLVVALVFVLHPLQTQAVTYIVQRFSSLAALLYLASLACFVWGRITRRPAFYVGVVGFGALAVLTKQNAVTLPFALLLIELLFFRELPAAKRWWIPAGVLLLVLAAVGLLQIDTVDRLTRETADISRIDYLATQMEVLWRYVSLVYYPVGLRVEYDLPLQSGFSDTGVWLALAGHLALILLAFSVWSRLPFIAFGILFFYLAHAVESSVIPIRDIVFEHRMYLPMLGIATATVAALLRLAQRFVVPRAVVAMVLAAGLLVLGGMTLARNETWRDPLTLLRIDTELSPGSQRAWTSYAKELMRRGKFEEALPALAAALNLGRTQEGLEVAPQTLVNTVIALYYTNQPRKAAMMESWLEGIELLPVEQSRLYEVKGLWLLRNGQIDAARQHLDLAAEAFPNPMAEAGLAAVDAREGNRDAAMSRARAVLAQDPDNPLALRVMSELQGSAPPADGMRASPRRAE